MATALETTALNDLRLGYTIVQAKDGKRYGEHVCYLEESWGPAGEYGFRFETTFLPEARNRLINPEEYQFKGLPLSPHEIDLPAELKKPKLTLHPPVLRHTPLMPRNIQYNTSKDGRLLKHILKDDLHEVGISHRALRYASQVLHPSANITVYASGNRHTAGRIKAVAYGISGAPLAVLLHGKSVSDDKATMILESDFWINAQDVRIAVHDKRSPGRTLLTIHKLQQVTAFNA